MIPLPLDATKVQFTSTDNVDKIPVYSTTTDGQGAGVNGSLAVPAVTAPLPLSSSVFYATIPNPYGRKLLPTMSWSIDGINYYPQNTQIFYFNATYNKYLTQALGFMGVSDSLIYICCTTQYTSVQTMYVQFALDAPS